MKVLVVKYKRTDYEERFGGTDEKLTIQTKNYGKDIHYRVKAVYEDFIPPAGSWATFVATEKLEMRINIDEAGLEETEIKKRVREFVEWLKSDEMREISDIYNKLLELAREICMPYMRPGISVKIFDSGGDPPARSRLEFLYYA